MCIRDRNMIYMYVLFCVGFTLTICIFQNLVTVKQFSYSASISCYSSAALTKLGSQFVPFTRHKKSFQCFIDQPVLRLSVSLLCQNILQLSDFCYKNNACMKYCIILLQVIYFCTKPDLFLQIFSFICAEGLA